MSIVVIPSDPVIEEPVFRVHLAESFSEFSPELKLGLGYQRFIELDAGPAFSIIFKRDIPQVFNHFLCILHQFLNMKPFISHIHPPCFWFCLSM